MDTSWYTMPWALTPLISLAIGQSSACLTLTLQQRQLQNLVSLTHSVSSVWTEQQWSVKQPQVALKYQTRGICAVTIFSFSLRYFLHIFDTWFFKHCISSACSVAVSWDKRFLVSSAGKISMQLVSEMLDTWNVYYILVYIVVYIVWSFRMIPRYCFM